jgi:K+ transporter
MVSSVAAGESGGNLHSADTPRAGFFALMLGSIGVVYGDIGTSPLYAVGSPSPRRLATAMRQQRKLSLASSR